MDSATVQIFGTKLGEKYTGTLNGKLITIPTVSRGGTVSLKIATKDLNPDTNTVTVLVKVQGCGEFPLQETYFRLILS